MCSVLAFGPGALNSECHIASIPFTLKVSLPFEGSFFALSALPQHMGNSKQWEVGGAADAQLPPDL